jgi:hypothetical protein
MTSVTKAGNRDVHGDLQRHGVQDPQLLEVLSPVIRGIESSLMDRVKQDQRMQELVDKQEQQARTTGDRLDKMVLFNLTNQANNLLDKYADARGEHTRLTATIQRATA